MAPRRTHRGSSGPPSGGRRRGERKFRKAGKKGGVCSFSLPSAAAATAVALSLLVLVRWQTGGAR